MRADFNSTRLFVAASAIHIFNIVHTIILLCDDIKWKTRWKRSACTGAIAPDLMKRKFTAKEFKDETRMEQNETK